MKIVYFIISCPLFCWAQWTELSPAPEAVSNNAVISALSSDGMAVYSFAGIGRGKTFRDIHRKCFKYSTEKDEWRTLDELPAGNGRIAAGASTIKNKIYIVGGYEVFQNGSERSFNNVHVFDPITDQFEEDAKSIPIPIDDHVQAVWRDSLLYVITGWSNNQNVADVQIYDPTSDNWKAGTPLPNSSLYKVFGASGTIVNDTIYFSGGARQLTNFPPSNLLRIGVINPLNPYEIEWSPVQDDRAIGYRMASDNIGHKPFWLGGSRVTYNYDGIAYNGTGGVEPLSHLTLYNPSTNEWEIIDNVIPPTMDFRGLAKISEGQYILVGGMKENQTVTDRCIQIDLRNISASSSKTSYRPIHPNPATNHIILPSQDIDAVFIFNLKGQMVTNYKLENNMILIDQLPSGTYLILVKSETRLISQKVIKQ